MIIWKVAIIRNDYIYHYITGYDIKVSKVNAFHLFFKIRDSNQTHFVIQYNRVLVIIIRRVCLFRLMV